MLGIWNLFIWRLYLKSLLPLTPGTIKYYGIVIKRINQIFISVNDIVHTKVVNIKRLMIIPIPAENETMSDNTL